MLILFLLFEYVKVPNSFKNNFKNVLLHLYTLSLFVYAFKTDFYFQNVLSIISFIFPSDNQNEYYK